MIWRTEEERERGDAQQLLRQERRARAKLQAQMDDLIDRFDKLTKDGKRKGGRPGPNWTPYDDLIRAMLKHGISDALVRTWIYNLILAIETVKPDTVDKHVMETIRDVLPARTTKR